MRIFPCGAKRHGSDAKTRQRHEKELAMPAARSIYRATLVSSATLASQALDAAGAARSAMDDEEHAEQGYWYQALEFQGAEEYLRYRHFSLRAAEAPVYWNWRD
jgi:hypothetical protein